MTTREQWLALAERCEKTPGAAREIDCDIAALLGWEKHDTSGYGGFWINPEKRMRVVPLWTDSIDAISRLIDRELPSCDWQLCRGGECTLIYGGSVYEPLSVDAKAATVDLALCAAFCRATAEKATE